MSSEEKNENRQTLLEVSKTHMSGSDIEVLDVDSDSNSIEVLNTGEHTQIDNSTLSSFSKINIKEACFDVNAHGHKPTPKAKMMDGSSSTMEQKPESSRAGCSGEYREIISDNDYDDAEDNEDATIDESSSSPSSPSQISPNHRIVYTKDSMESPDEESQDQDAGNIERPDSLSLPRPLQYVERHRQHQEYYSDSCSDVSRSSSTAALIEEASKTPLTRQGTVIHEGDMIAFVADGLNDMIKKSSPLSRTDSSMSGSLQSPGVQSVSSVSSSNSAWSEATSSASEWSKDYSRMSRPRVKKVKKSKVSPSILTGSPDDIPSVDPRAVMELEVYASKVANSLQHMMGTLKNNLFKMSALTYHGLDAHKDGVDRSCDSVDSSIKSMYALMAKCEELSKSVQPVYKIHGQIKEIERLLDLFEGQLAKEEK